ncbi:MAG: type II toxin-antitoxin system RelE/ParE family toxin [Opitutaceae bacterium]|jgi:plasmid stabilization system protein ParE
MAELIWSEPALRQLEAIIEYIALDKPAAAKRVAQTVFGLTDNVEQFKLIGRVIPEFPVARYRQIWVNPCWIYYKATEEDVTILHVRRAESLFRIEDLEV